VAVKVAEHGKACTKERTGAVAVRAALESAVQVGRGNEGNLQAETANPTKRRDSLQYNAHVAARYAWIEPFMEILSFCFLNYSSMTRTLSTDIAQSHALN
jgi:hypothetical protein